ncbi:N-acetylmannosamine kinase [Photobacterium sanctipauli]|uniref:N-acetylmannosamine kinase n=2 Tax=Photobacterium sanctipauli TaxID=1342794 RepID=A0A2T3NUL1_9GAMM|nr:N-acetylmannosamine kinase [Photobacterium sanctipauli]PSW19931.1 N-acetylmannosamine kinase [Photobacterium sanctipauli]
MKTYLAVDIGGTKLAAALISQGLIIEREQISTPSSQSPEALSDALAALLVPLAQKADVVAVASTGIINNGILHALNPANLGGLNAFPLQAVIAEMTGLETVVINDAQAAAWAEFQALEEQSSTSMAFITVSTGVGAGLVNQGNLLVGARGIAGHAGHMLADPTGPQCGCGRIGCVESIASGTAIGREGEAFFGKETTGYDVYQQFLAGNQDAERIVRRSAKAIANLIADLTISLDLDVVTLGGSVGLAEGYLNMVSEYLEAQPAVYRPKVIPAQTGADAGLIGVASWAANQATKSKS